MKRILLTGVGGFIGTHCLKYFLNNTDWDIVGLDSFRHKGTYSRLNELDLNNERLTILKHDLTVPIDEYLENRIMGRAFDANGITEKGIDYIVNMASDSAVERSVSDPGQCWRNNCELIYNMLELARRIKPKIFYQVSCYDEETRVMTPNGFKFYTEIKTGDKILSLNSTSGLLEEKIVEKIIVQDYEGEIFHFKKGRTDLAVTPNHRMFYQNKFGIQIDSAENLIQKSYSYKLPKASWKGKKNNKISVSGVGEVDTKDLFYLCGLFIGDGFVNRQIKEFKNKSGLNRSEFLKECRDKSGKFVSKGKIGNLETSKSVSHRIWLDIPFNDMAFPKACAVLDRLGIKYTTPKNKSGEHIYFSSEAWLNWFQQFGTYAENKHIPNWMLEFDIEFLDKLLEGLIDSDGNTAITNSYSTCSATLVRDVCELGIKLGYFPHFKKRYCESWFKKEQRMIKGIGYQIYLCKTSPRFSRENLNIKNYSGKIWCLKVQDNKSLIVERNGYLAISGNTDEIYGDCPQGYFHPEWDTVTPSNPYAASKAAQEALAISYWRSYNVPVVITNCINCIGTMQDKEKFLPKLISKIAKGEEMQIYADFKPDGSYEIGSRSYLHCDNHADIFVWLSDKPISSYANGDKLPDKYNVCSDVQLNNLEMAELIAKIMGKPLKYKLVPSQSARPGYDKRYALSGKKLKDMGWNPPIDFVKGIEQIVNWSLEHPWWVI